MPIKKNLARFDMTPIMAKKILKGLVKDSSRIFFTNHAEEMMIKRRITRKQVFRCLESGQVIEAPFFDAPHGNWKVTLRRISAGDVVSVAVALDREEAGDFAVIVTVIGG